MTEREKIRVRSGVSFYELSNLDETHERVLAKLVSVILNQSKSGLFLASTDENNYSVFELLFEFRDEGELDEEASKNIALGLLLQRL